MWGTAGSGLHGLDHAPAADRPVLEHLEDQPLDAETEHADDEEAAEHDIRVEVFLRVEDHPAEAPAGRGDHLAAHDRDPRPRERLAEPGDHERERAREDHPAEHRALPGAHGLGGTYPDAVHGFDAGP